MHHAETQEETQQVTHVPLWVKGLIGAGLVLCAVQMASFRSSLADSVQKNRAEIAYSEAQYTRAIDLYKDLHHRYSNDKKTIRFLGFSYYRSGLYAEAIDTFNKLAGIEMPKGEVDEINAAILDIQSKLGLESNGQTTK